jgi:amino acid efflux transporter
MKQSFLGTFQLSGLMIGPILGAGVILFPPLIYQKIGSHAIWAWLVIMILGGFFAAIFAKLALAFPGKEGVSKAVRNAFGPVVGQLASNFIMSAVCVGPVAVLATAASEIARAAQLPDNSIPLISGGLLVCCLLMLLRNVTAVGKITLICSSIVTIILILGSILTIAGSHPSPIPDLNIDPLSFGQVLLLLFWTIVGWELLGNYSSEVRVPHKTIPRATILSVAIISGTYLMVAWAIHCCKSDVPGITDIVKPLLGNWTASVLSGITTLLCVSTYLMIVGGITRLAYSLAKDGRLPALLAGENRNGAPANAVFLYGCFHLLVIVLLQFDIIQLEQVIAFANVFFLSNALLCILASIYLLDSTILRLSGGMLCLGFTVLLFFSSPWILGMMLLEIAATFYYRKILPGSFPERILKHGYKCTK